MDRAVGADVGHDVALVGAVTATLAPVIAMIPVVVAAAVWSLGDAGPSNALRGMIGALGFVGLAGAVAMVVNYALGLPVALAIERRVGDRPRYRLACYGGAGAAVGGLVGLWFAGATVPALVFVAFGLVAALGGAVGVGWARSRPVVVARQHGWMGTLALTTAAMVGWLSTGLVVVPLLAAALVGTLALLISSVFRPTRGNDGPPIRMQQ